MKLLTRLRELRNQNNGYPTYNLTEFYSKNDSEVLGVGTVTTSDIARLDVRTNSSLETDYSISPLDCRG
jgi:hypothetical protein